MPVETNIPGAGATRSWRERVDAVWSAAATLLSTRAEIFREELAEKGTELRRAAIGIGLGLVLAWLALLLLTALVAVLLARLFGSAAAGLFAALFLYAAVAAVAAGIGWRALSRVRPLDFPATREGIEQDWKALQEFGTAPEEAPESEPADDFEERFRTGSE